MIRNVLVKVTRRSRESTRTSRRVKSSTASSEASQNILDDTVSLLDDIIDAKLRLKLSHTLAQREVFDAVAQSLNITSLADWYRVNVKQVQTNRLGTLRFHPLSFPQFTFTKTGALKAVYPDHTWSPEKFSTKPRGHWRRPENLRTFFENLSNQQGFQSRDDFYNLSKSTVIAAGGSGLMDTYTGSVYRALAKSFPEHTWLPWKFKNPPKNLWRDMNARRMFLDWVARQMMFDPTDVASWLGKVGPKDIIEHGGGGLLTNYYAGSLTAMLRDVYKELEWPP